MLYSLQPTDSAAQITIATARTMAEGATVTVRGIVTNGGELGVIRYLQDPTGGIGAYSSSLSNLQRGDSVEVTGVLDLYNNLLEINPVNSFSVLSTGNELPAPFIVNMAVGFSETYEGRLVQFNDASFISTGNFQTASANYTATDGSVSSAEVRINSTSNIAGTPIPVGNIGLLGIMSQFCSSPANGCTTGYQLLPRDLNDFILAGNPPVFTAAPGQANISTDAFSVYFETLYPGSTILYYGATSALGAQVTDAALVTNHDLFIGGLEPATLYFVRAASVSASGDTSFSSVIPMMTRSLSSQTMTPYFTRSADNSVAQGTAAVTLAQTMDDTLIAYMNRTVYTMDIAIYNMDNNNGIVDAINAAYNRGVNVRVIGDGDNMDQNAWSQLNVGAGNKKLSPTGIDYGIMHNKFVIMDAGYADKAFLWTGSMNFTNQQVSNDANNVIIFQDQSIAKAYQIEFNEMWSGLFGPDKSNNTPKEFNIGGNRVELYFSPSDDTETQIKRTATSADHDLQLCMFAYTRFSISYAIDDRTSAGVWGGGIIDDTANGSFAYSILASDMVGKLFVANHSYSVHNKYLLVDANAPGLDPAVLTGSHNWSTSAQFSNDENTVIVHNAQVANQYYQEWVARYKDEGGTLLPGYNVGIGSPNSYSRWLLYPNPATDMIIIRQDGMQAGEVYVRITDLAGRTLMQQSYRGGDDALIPVQSLNAGLYLAVIESGGDKAVIKFQVVR